MSPDPGWTALHQSQPVVIKAVGISCAGRILRERGEGIWDQIGADVFSGDLRIANMEFAVNPDCVVRISGFCPGFMPCRWRQPFGKFIVVSLANNH